MNKNSDAINKIKDIHQDFLKKIKKLEQERDEKVATIINASEANQAAQILKKIKSL